MHTFSSDWDSIKIHTIWQSVYDWCKYITSTASSEIMRHCKRYFLHVVYGGVLQWETLRTVWTELPTSVEAWHVSSSLLAMASSTVRTSTCNATAAHHREPSVHLLSCKNEHLFFMDELLSLSPLSVSSPKLKDLQTTRSSSLGDNHTVKWLSNIQTCHERFHICAWI